MDAPSPLLISFQNRLSDHLHAHRLYRSRGFLSKTDKVVAVVLFLYGLWAIQRAGLRWWTVAPIPLAAMEWFDLLSITPLQVYVGFKRNPKFRETYAMEFGDQDVHFKAGAIESRIEWSFYSGLMEDKRVFLLLYGKGMYTVLPKSAFGEATQIERFRELAARRLRTA